MKVSVYNILWADNNSDSLRNSMDIRRAFECDEYTINVLNYSQTTDELERDMEVFKDRVDAVVFGDNLKKNETTVYGEEGVKEVELSGLIHAYSLMQLCNRNREIPFIFCSDNVGRANPLCNKLGLTYFTDGDRIVGKDYDQLSEKIRDNIKRINSPEHRVEEKYKVLLDMAKLDIGEACEKELRTFLLAESKDTSYNEGVGIFNSLRNIMEEIVTSCRNNLIVPDVIKELNDFMYYFAKPNGWCPKDSKKGYKPKSECKIMPMAISNYLESLIEMLQDGSHKKEVLSLYVSEYVIAAQTPFLFRSCLYQVLEIINWHHKILERLDKGELPFERWETYENTKYKQGEKKSGR